MSNESIKLNGFNELQQLFSENKKEITEEEFISLFADSMEDDATSVNIDRFVQNISENYDIDSIEELSNIISKMAANDGNEESLSVDDLISEDKSGTVSKEKTFDASELDMSQWSEVKAGQDKALGFLWNTGSYTYKTSNGIEIKVQDIENVQIYENKETGEVIVAGADGAEIKGSKKDALLTIYDSDINTINTAKGNDNIKIFNSTVQEINTGKGTDSVTIENSVIGKLNTGSGNDFVSVSDSTVSNVNTSSSFFGGILDDGEDTVILHDSKSEKIKTGRGSDNIISENSSVDTLKTGGGSDSLSLDDTEVDNLKTNKKDLVVENKNYMDFDISKISEIKSNAEIPIDEETTITVSDYTNYILSQETGFDTEEEYQEYTIETLSANLETMKAVFQNQEDSDGVVAGGYNALKELTGLGITSDDVEAIIAEQEAMIEGLTAALNGTSGMSFEEAYEYYTGTTYSQEKLDKYMEISKVYSAVLTGSQFDEDYADKFEEATGMSFETLSKEYSLCQLETFGKSDALQDLVDKYSEDQEGFADKLSAVITAAGITCIVAGAVVSFVFPPAAGVGMGLMTAGKYISLGGMFTDNVMDLVDDSTDADGLTKEEFADIALETGVEAVSYAAGRGIGKLTNGLNSVVSSKAADAGVGKVGSYLLGQTAETASDTVLSLGADYAIAQGQSLITTGEFMDADEYWSMDRFLGEGKNQLMGILTGLASSKVSAYQQGIIATAQGKVLDGDLEGAKAYLKASGMKMTDAAFEGFVEQVKAAQSQADASAAKPVAAGGADTETRATTDAETVKESADTETVRADADGEITEEPPILKAGSEDTDVEAQTKTDTDTAETVKTADASIVSEDAPIVQPKKLISSNPDGKLYIEDPATKTSFEIFECDEAAGIYKYKDETGAVCEYKQSEGIISKYNMQGKPGFEVLKLSSQILVDENGNPIEVRKKIKTDKNGNIKSYKAYNADGTKIINTTEMYPDGVTIKKQSLYDDGAEPKVVQELNYREDGSLLSLKEYKNNSVKYETEYKEDGTTIASKKEYKGNTYVQQDFDESGKVKTETEYLHNKQKISTTEFEYGDNGEVKLQTKYDASQKKISETEFEYDSAKKLTSKTETTFEHGNRVLTIKYEYDENGDVISTIKTEYDADGVIKKVTNLNDIPKVDSASLYQKIQSQLRNPSTEDVEKVIDILQKNGASPKEAAYALQVLTQFGNVSALADALKSSELDINGFVRQKVVDTNSALNYFCNNKSQIALTGFDKGFVLDDSGLAYLESLSPEKLQKFLSRSDVQFINLEGWDAGLTIYSQGGDISSISTKASEYISQAKTLQTQENISFEDAFKRVVNNATLERAAKLGITDITTISPTSATLENAAPGNVVKNLTPLSVSEDTIDTKAEAISKALFSDAAKQAKAKELILGYLDSQADVYSPQRLGERMLEIDGQIKDTIKTWTKADGSAYTMDDVYYLVPYTGKSYEQVLLQYAKLNGIDNDHIIYAAANSPDLPDGKIYVAFDDVVGSGQSMLNQSDGVNYSKITDFGERHFILAPIISSSEGAQRILQGDSTDKSLVGIEMKGRTGQDVLLVDESNTMTILKDTDFYQSLSSEEQTMMLQILDAFGGSKYGSTGFNSKALSIIFPYMAPDNDSALASFFFGDMFLNPSGGMKNYFNSKDSETKKILAQLNKIK